jgi:hypothetical protein
VLSEQLIEQRLGPVEVGTFQFFDCVEKTNQAAFRREIKHAEGAGYTQAFSLGHAHAFAIVHQQ